MSSINAHPLNSEIVGRTLYCCPSFIYRDAVGRSRDRSCAPPIGQSPACVGQSPPAVPVNQPPMFTPIYFRRRVVTWASWPAYQVSNVPSLVLLVYVYIVHRDMHVSIGLHRPTTVFLFGSKLGFSRILHSLGARSDCVNAFGWNSTESEPIWMKSGVST